MTYQPVLVGSGLSGWQFLQSTLTSQKNAFAAGAQITRDTAYFEANIADIKTAGDLVADRRLLRVALGAYGLQDDLDNKFFIRKILEEGTNDPSALANRLADDRYKKFSQAFGFGDQPVPRTALPRFSAETLELYQAQQFEIAVGNQDETLRLAMNLQRELPEIAEGSGNNNAKWFLIMGTPPLRKVFETALGLPASFGQIDIDRQLDILKDRAESRFGTDQIAELGQSAPTQKLVQSFLLQSQVNEVSATGKGQVALLLLQSISRRRL